MKKIVLLSLTLLMTLLFLTACGVPQKDYDKLASDLAAAQAQIQSLKNQLNLFQSLTPLQKFQAAIELVNIQSGVISIITSNTLARLPNGDFVTTPTNDMAFFPDPSNDSTRYVLYPNGGNTSIKYQLSQSGNNTGISYVSGRYTRGTYTVDAVGTVTQVTTGY